MLHAVAAGHEFVGQIIQQLRMRGALAHAAKIIGRGHDAAAEVILPDAVHHHARRQRILRIHDPLGQRLARITSIRGKLGNALRKQHARRSHADSVALITIIATRQQVDRGPLVRIVGHAEQCRKRRRHPVFEVLQFLLELGTLLVFGVLHRLAELLHLALHRLGLGFPDHLLLGGELRHIAIVRGGEVGLQAIVVALAEGIEFVIVATRAADGNAQQRGTHDVSHLGKHFIAAAGYFLIAGVFAQRSEAVKARGDQVFVLLRRNLIAGQLLQKKAIVGLVVVESANHVIAIAPGIAAVRVVFEAVGFREADDVEPVLAPALAVMRAGQQVFD